MVLEAVIITAVIIPATIPVIMTAAVYKRIHAVRIHRMTAAATDPLLYQLRLQDPVWSPEETQAEIAAATVAAPMSEESPDLFRHSQAKPAAVKNKAGIVQNFVETAGETAIVFPAVSYNPKFK